VRGFDGAQLCVEVCSPCLRIVRMAGVLDPRTVSRLAGLIGTQVARPACTGHIVVELGEVGVFATDDLGPLKGARDAARACGIRLHLAGVSARESLLPIGVRTALAEFSMFPTAEHAERDLLGRPIVVPLGRPRSSHGWPCPRVGGVEDGRSARSDPSVLQ
jgi:hypothetical protein